MYAPTILQDMAECTTKIAESIVNCGRVQDILARVFGIRCAMPVLRRYMPYRTTSTFGQAARVLSVRLRRPAVRFAGAR